MNTTRTQPTLTETSAPIDGRPPKVRTKPSASQSVFDRSIVRSATIDSFRKLDPRSLAKNPVMLIVEVGALLTSILFIRDLSSSTGRENAFAALVAAFLWFTVLFANFAEAMAEGRGKAQAATLRATRADTLANVLAADGGTRAVPSADLQVGDRCGQVGSGNHGLTKTNHWSGA